MGIDGVAVVVQRVASATGRVDHATPLRTICAVGNNGAAFARSLRMTTAMGVDGVVVVQRVGAATITVDHAAPLRTICVVGSNGGAVV